MVVFGGLVVKVNDKEMVVVVGGGGRWWWSVVVGIPLIFHFG